MFPLVVAASPAFGQEGSVAEVGAAIAPKSIETPISSSESDDDEEDEEIRAVGDEILVVATRMRGQIDAPQPPILTLGEAEIASYGAASLDELLTQLSPQTGSGRGRGDGRPVILLNGQRISSFREMRNIPPEAIRRVEVLPEEVALRYGYPPNQRVVNFILKDNFASKTVDGEYDVPTRGGFAESELEGSLLRMDGPSRLNLSIELEDTSPLTEAERGVLQTADNISSVASDPDPARFRTLIDDSRELSLNGTWATGLGEGARSGSLSINGTVTRSDTRSFNGLDTVLLTAPDGSTALRSLPDPLARTSRSTKFEAGLAVNKPIGGWQLTATIDGSYSDTDTRVEQPRDLSALVAAAASGTLPIAGALPAIVPGLADRAETHDMGVRSLATFAGHLFRLPAGEAALTVKAGFDYIRSENSDTRTGGGALALDRSDLSAGVNLSLPITSRRENVLDGVGDVSLNLSAGLNRLSDFGSLSDWSAGITWAPTEKVGLQASYIVDQAAPSLNQLGNPELLSFNVPVFDFTRGETAVVTVINGGNPALRRETQRDLKLAANWELPFLNNSNLLVEYFRNRSSDVTQDFPLLTPEIEAAFPGRVVRDASGRLVSIDRRPVTFSEIKSSRMRWGFNLAGTIGKPQPDGQRGGMMGMIPGGGRGRGFGGPRGPGGGFRGAGGGQGRWNLSVYHTYRFSEQVIVAPGGPVLDLLDGNALSAGGVARHGVEMEGGAFYKGFGLRLNGNWKPAVTVRSTGAPGSTDLRFGALFKLDARLFVNFDQQKSVVEKVPFLKGARLSLKIDNLFDSRQRVTDATGDVPLSYQADYRDPRGRVIGLDFRKMF